MDSEGTPTYFNTGKHWLSLTPMDFLQAYSGRQHEKGRRGNDGRVISPLKLILSLYLFHDNAFWGELQLFRISSPEQPRHSNTNAFAIPTEEVTLRFDMANNMGSYSIPDQHIPIEDIIEMMLDVSSPRGGTPNVIPVDLDYAEPLIAYETEIPEMAGGSTSHEFIELGVIVVLSLPSKSCSIPMNKDFVVDRIGRGRAYYQPDTTKQDFQKLNAYRDLEVYGRAVPRKDFPAAETDRLPQDTEGARSLDAAFMDNAKKAFERYEQWHKDTSSEDRGF